MQTVFSNSSASLRRELLVGIGGRAGVGGDEVMGIQGLPVRVPVSPVTIRTIMGGVGI